MEEESVQDVDPDFEPRSRPRSCTWPNVSTVKPEGEDVGETAPGIVLASGQGKDADSRGGATSGVGVVTPRKGGSRRNAWGNQSYAELITQAIESSPEKRLTLSQIYDWMVNTVPYFKDKGDSNSSVGWKNSIRHNLSLHSKFLRVQNEASGKSSWWTLNPEAGRSAKESRQRHSMDNCSKLLKSRAHARQAKAARAAALRQREAAPEGAPPDPPSQSHPGRSPSPRGYLDNTDVWTSFRSRTGSNASSLSGRRSPVATALEDEEAPMEEPLVAGALAESSVAELDLSARLTLIAGQQGGTSPQGSSTAPPTCLHSMPTLVPSDSSFLSLCSTQPSAPPAQAAPLPSPRWVGPPCCFGPGSQDVTYGAHLPSGMGALFPGGHVSGIQGASHLPNVSMAQLDSSLGTQGFSLKQLQALAGHSRGRPPQAGAGSGFPMPETARGHIPFLGNQDQLPTDLDADMFTENLDCDIDYIINSDLLDGEAVDFNFDMIPPVNQGCHGNLQDSFHNWVPS
ncbi:forkhead box protein O4-like [Paramormyrops kingsleyae]|uniref:forkhead box protein O4-like n=1 Tax=Paramormyrops kingsleyae TaxID=1676925 RepID=UPI003B97689F